MSVDPAVPKLHPLLGSVAALALVIASRNVQLAPSSSALLLTVMVAAEAVEPRTVRALLEVDESGHVEGSVPLEQTDFMAKASITTEYTIHPEEVLADGRVERKMF